MGNLFHGKDNLNDTQNSEVVPGTLVGKAPLPVLQDHRAQLELLADILACIFVEQGQPLCNERCAQNLQTTTRKA